MQIGKSKPKSSFQFFLLLFAFSIPLWIIDFIIDAKRSSLNFSVIDIITAFFPIISACILVYNEEGKKGIIALLKRIFDFARIKNKIWFLAIVLLPFVIYFLIYCLILFFEFSLPTDFEFPFQSIPSLFILFFISAICEETGYMGYAYNALREKFSTLSTSFIIGFLWAIWHYPSIIQQGYSFYWIFWATVGTVSVRVLIVWIFKNTGQSLFACILFHAFLNLGRPLFPNNITHNPLVDYPEIHYGLIAFVTLIVVTSSRKFFFSKHFNFTT